MERLRTNVSQAELVSATEPGIGPGYFTLPAGAIVQVETMVYASDEDNIEPEPDDGFLVVLRQPTDVALYSVEPAFKPARIGTDKEKASFTLTNKALQSKREEFREIWNNAYPGTFPRDVYPGVLTLAQIRANRRYAYGVGYHELMREPISEGEYKLLLLEQEIEDGEREIAEEFIKKYGRRRDIKGLDKIANILLLTSVKADLFKESLGDRMNETALIAVNNLLVRGERVINPLKATFARRANNREFRALIAENGLKNLPDVPIDDVDEPEQPEVSGDPQIIFSDEWLPHQAQTPNKRVVEGELTELQNKILETFASLPVQEQVIQASLEKDPILADRMKGVAIRTVLGLGRAGDKKIQHFDITAWKTAETDTLFSSFGLATADFGVQVSCSNGETGEKVDIYANKHSLTAGLTFTQSNGLSQRIELFAKQELFDSDTST